MKMTLSACTLCAILLAACSDGTRVNVAETPSGAQTPGEIDFSDPESVFAAYSTATEKGDAEGIKQTLRPSQRDMFGFATGTGGGSLKYTIVKRAEISPRELHLYVKFEHRDEVLPHVLVREDGNWYIDIERTSMMIFDSMGNGKGPSRRGKSTMPKGLKEAFSNSAPRR